MLCLALTFTVSVRFFYCLNGCFFAFWGIIFTIFPKYIGLPLVSVTPVFVASVSKSLIFFAWLDGLIILTTYDCIHFFNDL